MARQPLPDDALTWELGGREFVQFSDDMYVYEYTDGDQLARVLPEDLPQRPAAANPDVERLREELLATQSVRQT